MQGLAAIYGDADRAAASGAFNFYNLKKNLQFTLDETVFMS